MSGSPFDQDAVVANAAAQALLERAAMDVKADGLPSVSLHVRQGDEVLLDAVIGAPQDSTHLLWSASKGCVAAVIGALLSRRRLSASTLVCEVLPWFVGDGKQDVTVAHLLLHTAGLARAPMQVVQGADRAQRRERMAGWRTAHQPGEAFAYHHTAAHWVLATIVEEVTGEAFEATWQSVVAEPLGLTTLTFQPDPKDKRLQALAAVGDTTPPAVVANLAGMGIDLESMVGEADVDTLLTFGDPEVLAAGSPGAGAVGSARDLASLYAALLAGHEGVWNDEVRRDLVGNVRNLLPDPGLAMPANRTLGFVVSGDDGKAGLRELPASLGPRVFGQPGMCGQIAWADPDTDLVFTSLTNGLHRDPLDWWARVAEYNELAARVAVRTG